MKKISRVLLAIVLSLFMIFATGCIDNGGSTEYAVNVVNASEIAGKGAVSWNNGNGGKVVKGGNVTITFTEQEGYEFASVEINGVDKTADVEDNSITITGVNEHLNLVVQFAESFAMQITQSTGGTITVDKPFASAGDTVVYTITPNSSYVIESVLDGTTDVTSQLVDGKLTLTNVTANHNVSATFTRLYSITAQSALNGTVTLEKNQVKSGESVSATITPSNGYTIASVKVNGEDVTSSLVGGVLTISNVSEDVVVEAIFRLESRTITIVPCENGTVVASKTEGAIGELVTLTINSAVNYELASLLVNGVECKDEVINGKFYNFTLTQNTTITPIFAKKQYAITINGSQNGQITCDKTTESVGETIIFTVVPAPHYELESLTVNGVDKTYQVLNGEYSHVMTSNVTVNATFRLIDYTVTIQTVENGTLTADKTKAKYNETVTFTVLPNDNYELESFIVNGSDVTADVENGTYVHTVDGAVNASATFKANLFDVIVNPSAFGVVTPSSNKVVANEEVTFTIVPNAHYELDFFLVNGRDEYLDVVDNQYVCTVNERIVISAGFKLIDYTIEIEDSENGTLTADKETANYGEEVTFTIIANEHYELESLTINGLDVTADVENDELVYVVDGNVNASATFKIIDYTVDCEEIENGTLTANKETANYGEEVIFTIIANEHYELESFTINGEDMTAYIENDQYSHVVDGDVSAEAIFKAIEYVVEIEDSENGTVVAGSDVVTIEDVELVLTIEPDEHYELESIIVNGEDMTADVVDGELSYTIDGEISVSATFTLINYTVSGIEIEEGYVTANKESATYGETVVFTAYKNAGYEGYTIVAFKVNGEDKLSELVDGIYEHDVDGNVEITEFVLSRVDYVVTVEPIENGRIELSKSGALLNEEIEITVIPNAHYEVLSFTVDGEDKLSELVNNKYVIIMTDNVTASATFKLIDYTVDCEEIENGTLTADKETANYNEEVIFTITADEHYELESLTINGLDVTADVENDELVYVVDGNVNASATFKLIDYTIDCEDSENGTLTADKETANYNEEVTFTITANERYELESLTINGSDVTADVENDELVYVVDGSVNASATFKLIDYVVENFESATGSVIADKETANYNETVIFTVMPLEHYETVEFTVNGFDVLDQVVDGQYEHVVYGNVVVGATFAKKIYSLSTSSNELGSVQIRKAVREEGDEEYVEELTATFDEEIEVVTYANVYCSLASLTLNGEEITVENGRATIKLTQDSVLSAVFVEDVYQITKNTDTNGLVELSSTTAKGEDVVTITATPNNFYKLATFKVNGEDVDYQESAGSYVYQIVVLSDVEVEVTFEIITFNVTHTVSEGGTLVDVANVTDGKANAGANVKFTIRTLKGYKAVVTDNGVETIVGIKTLQSAYGSAENTSYTISGIDSDHVINIEFVKIHKVSLGTFNVDQVSALIDGLYTTYVLDAREIEIVLTPTAYTKNDNTYYYEIKSLLVGGVERKTYLIKNVARVKVYGDCSVDIEMQEATIKYDLVIEQSENGTISYEGSTSLSEGDEIVITVTPDAHCTLENLYINGVAVSGFTGGDYELTMPDEDVEITATFVKNVYTVTVPTVSNGSVVASANNGHYGDEIIIDVTANAHYELSVFTVNGEDKTSEIVDGKYTFILDENVNVQASFVKKVYTISLTPPFNGNATANKLSGNYGDVITIEISCRTNYETKELLVNGVNKVSEIRNGKYSFTLEGDTTVVVVNGKASFKVVVNPTTNGTVIVDKTEVEINDTVNFTITPDAHCQLKTFTINGVDKMSEIEEGTFSMVIKESITVNATFSIATYSITTNYDTTKGTISLNKEQAQYNTNVAIAVQPKSGYQISNIYINGQEVEVTNRSFWNNSAYTVTQDTLVEAVFAEKGVCYFNMPSSVDNATITISDGPYKIGQAVSFTISLRDNYAIKYFKINGVDVSSSITVRGTLSYTPSDENTSTYVVEVATEIKQYSITMTYTAGGSATLGKNTAIYSDEVTITTVPNSGYHLRGADITGASYRIVGNNLVMYDFNSDVTVNVLFEQDVTTTTYTGKVMYEDGLPVKGTQVSVSGTGVSKTLTTDENGVYSTALSPAVYTFKVANTYGMISSISTTTASKFNVYDVDDIILTTKKVGVDIGTKYQTSENSKITYSYDTTTKSEKIVATDTGIGLTYLDGMFTEEGVVFFSAKNTTNTSIANYENYPGIGMKLVNDYFSIDCHLGANNTSRFLPDGSWSTVQYVPNQSSINYNLYSNGGGAKYYFAFAKRGNTVYFLTSKDGKYDYELVSSYENDNLNGAFAWSLCVSANMTAYSTLQVELNDFRFSSNIDSIEHVLNAGEFESITSVNGSVSLGENVYMNGKAYRKIIVVPFDNYVLTGVSVNGTNVEFDKLTGGMYQAYVPISAKMNLVVSYGAQETKIEYSTGLADDTTLTYDTSLFRRNDQTITGADPGVMWVDPEDDPVYGGYFYVAITGGSAIETPGHIGAAFATFRSKDLANWEPIGEARDHNGNKIDGRGLELPYESWVKTNCWAPELTYETYVGTDGEKHNRYYIYFSASARDYIAGNNVPSSVDKWSQLYLGIGVADAPMGPYRLVDTSTYYQFYDKLDLSNSENREQINFYKNVSNVSQRTTNLLGENITLMTPPINFYKNNSALKADIDARAASKGLANGYWPAIDVSPFKDPATGELYLFFSQHTTEKLASGNTIWIMKMKDYITPDYSTMHIVSMPGYSVNVTDFKSYYRDTETNYRYTSDYTSGRITRFTYDGTPYGTGVNEGAHGIAHYDENTKQWLYYLTYSPLGYGARAYSVLQAVSTSPMGPYIKIDPTKGLSCNGMINFNNYQGNEAYEWATASSSLDYSQAKDMSASIDYMAGCGHHSFVQAGDEIFIMYHSFPNPVNNNNQNNDFMGRCLSVDEVSFRTSPVLKYSDIKSSTNTSSYLPMIYGSGPTYSLQPLPEVSSGYGNVADKANLSVTGGESTKKYLTDDIHVIHSVYKDWEYQVNNSATLTFDYSSNPQNMRAIMVYNSAQYAYALKSIDSIVLTLVDGREMTFTNVTNTTENAFDSKKVMRFGGSAILSFEELYVKKVVINVSTSGKYDTSNSTIRIGDVKILARLPGVKASEVSTKATIGNSLLNNSDGSVVFDGVFDDAIYQNKKVYYEDMGDFGISVTVAMAKEGFYVGTTVNDRHLYSAGNSGETTTKYHGLNRWYKNTYVKVGAYVGSKYDFNVYSTRSIDISPYSTRGQNDIISEVNVEGTINSGASKLFATESYFPYSTFNKTASEVEEVKVFVSYQRPLSKTDMSPKTYCVNSASVGYLEGYLTFDKNGYVGSGVNNFGSSLFGDSEVGSWSMTDADVGKAYVNESAVESVIYDSKAIGDNSSYTVKVSKESLNKNGYSGIVVQSSRGSRVFALDQNAKEINLYSFTLDGNKELVYSKGSYVAGTGFANLTVVKVGNTMNVLIDGTCVYSETDTTMSGTVNYGLYAYGDKTRLVSPTFSESVSGYDNINTAYAVCDNYSDVRITSNGSQIKIYPTIHTGGRVMSSINVNGTSYTSNLYGLTVSITSDVIVTVTTASAETTYAVSGKFTDKGVTSYGRLELVSSDKNNVYVTEEGVSYSINVPAGTYTVNAKKDFRKVASKTLSVSKATTYNPALYTVFLSAVTINGEEKYSTTALAYGRDGTSFSMEDRQVGVNVFLGAGLVENIVIDFTTENFADSTFFNSGKYEKDMTLGISMRTDDGRVSTMGFAGGRKRYMPTGVWSSVVDGPVNNPILLAKNPLDGHSRGVCEPGESFKIKFIKYDDVVYLYAYNPAIETAYKFVASYDLKNYDTSVQGKCYFLIFSGTSFVYNRVRILDVSYDTNDDNISSTLNSMPTA